MGKTFVLKVFLTSFIIPTIAFGITDAAINAKCAPSEKASAIASLNKQKATQPQLAGAIDACISSLNNAYNSCVNTINTAAATAAGTVNAGQLGQAQQFQGQENMANATSGMSQQDQAANQVCVNQYGSAQSACSFPGAQAAQGYASKVQALCAQDAAQAASNTQNMDKMADAAQQLTPPSPQSPSSPTNPGYTPPTSETPTTTTAATTPTNTTPNFQAPTFNPLANTSKALTDTPTDDKPNDTLVKTNAGYSGLTYQPVTFTGNEDKDLLNKFEKSSNPNSNGSPSNNSGTNLLAASGLKDSSSNDSTKYETNESIPTTNTPNSNNGSSDGMFLGSNFGTPFNFPSAPAVINPDPNLGKPITSKIVTALDLPRKEKFTGKEEPTKEKSQSLFSSLFKRKKNSPYRTPSSSGTNSSLDPNGKEQDSSNRPFVLGLFLVMSAIGGGLYRRYFLMS